MATPRVAFNLEGKIEPRRIRTADPLVKSQLLYRLSYRPSRNYRTDCLSPVALAKGEAIGP